jgi:PAS domain S-box-containing protein
LKESEEKYRSVVNNLKEVIFQTDSVGNLTFLNPAWTEITGFSVKESLGKNLSQFIDCRDRNFYQQQLQTLLSQEQANCRYQIHYLTQKNHIGWLEVYACTNVKANVVKIFGSGNDISDRKRREQYQQAEHGVTKILATSTSLEAAIKKIIQTLCHCLEWDLGEFWHQQNDVLACYQVEYLEPNYFRDFVQTTKQITFNLNSELPGKIWLKKQFHWISNLKEDLSFIRFQIATKLDLKIGFGFPIISEDEILGIIIFFSRQVQQFDDNLLQITTAIGSQIG